MMLMLTFSFSALLGDEWWVGLLFRNLQEPIIDFTSPISPPLYLVTLFANILSLPQSTFYHFLHLSNPSLFLNFPTSPTFQYFPTFPNLSSHFPLAYVLSFPYPNPLYLNPPSPPLLLCSCPLLSLPYPIMWNYTFLFKLESPSLPLYPYFLYLTIPSHKSLLTLNLLPFPWITNCESTHPF